MADHHTGPWGRREFLQATGAAGAMAAVSGIASAGPRDPGPKEDELLVGITSNTRMATAQVRVQYAMPNSAEVAHRNDKLGYMAIRLPDESQASAESATAEHIRRVPGVKYVEENATLEAFFDPDDPEFDRQYAPQLVNAPDAWDTTMGSDDVTIAIVDQGVDYEHEDLASRFGDQKGRDFVEGDSDPMPVDDASEYHGTHVAGIAAATTDDGTGIAGTSNSRLISCRGLNETGSGSLSDVADAVQWAADQGVDLVNMSLGGGGYRDTMKNAVSYALDKGVLPICAAGNSYREHVCYPAAHDECVAVSAIGENGEWAPFSNYGEEIEVTAPGVDVYSCSTRKGGYENLSGTSMATPAVTGVAALGLAAHPEWSASELRSKLRETAVDVGLPELKQGAGRVDAANLVAADGGNDEPPTANIALSTTEPTAGETVTFDGSASTDPDGDVVEYRWKDGTGNTLTGERVESAPYEQGTYVVSLTVTDDAGNTDTSSKTIEVREDGGGNNPPVARMKVSDSEPEVGQAVVIDASGSTDPDGDISMYRWEHGGKKDTGEVLDLTVSEKGPYEVTLIVDDDDGNTDSTTTVLQVGGDDGGGGNETPTAKMAVSTTNPKVGETVTFDGSASSDPDGTIVEYRWQDQAGTVLTGPIVETAPDENGPYEMTLTVVDENGATDSVSKTLQVGDGGGNNEAPTADFQIIPGRPDVGEPVDFRAIGSGDPDGNLVEYRWNFGDGTTETRHKSGHISHVYDAPGIYMTTLIVVDDDGATATRSIPVEVVDTEGPSAKFDISNARPNVGMEIRVDGSKSTDPDGRIVSYEWNFGEGTTATGKIATHRYDKPGVYGIFLTVTDEDGLSDTKSIPIRVMNNRSPKADFHVAPGRPTPGQTVRVDASKSIDPDGRIQQYKWGFGDGATATGRKATHSYDTPGVYRITLTAIDEKGSGDVKSILIRVVDGKEKNVARIGGRLEGPWDRNVYRYRSTLSNPTQVTIKLVGEGGKRDFDLYVTTDGREPTPQNYDNKSVTRDSNETITLKNVRPNQRFGILANSYAGRGAYNVIIEELGQ